MSLQADFPNAAKFTIHIFSVFSLPHDLYPWIPQIVVPSLPGKALKRQLPFRSDEGLFEDSFIEERRAGLEQFINKSVCSPGHHVTVACAARRSSRFAAPCSVTNRWSAVCCVCPSACVSAGSRVTPWPRTSAVFTCSCKRKPSTATTFLEKYDTRVVEGVGLKLWGHRLDCLAFLSHLHSLTLCLFSLRLSVGVDRCKVTSALSPLVCSSSTLRNTSRTTVTPPPSIPFSCAFLLYLYNKQDGRH